MSFSFAIRTRFWIEMSSGAWQTLRSSSKLIAVYVVAADDYLMSSIKGWVIISTVRSWRKRHVICSLFVIFCLWFLHGVEGIFTAPEVTQILLMNWHFTWQWGIFSNRCYLQEYCLKCWACLLFFIVYPSKNVTAFHKHEWMKLFCKEGIIPIPPFVGRFINLLRVTSDLW